MTVLLVDDQIRVLEATRTLVNWEAMGVDQVYTAESAAEAREIMERQAVDILLTDIEMPGENGIELQRWQAEKYPEILCVFLTSHADFGYAKEAIRNGAFDYIVQPAGIPEIEESIGRAVKGLAERKNLIALSRDIDDTMTQTMDHALQWSQWILRGDGTLVEKQISRMLEMATRDGGLTDGFRRRLHHAFMEACSMACLAREINPVSLYAAPWTQDRARHAHQSEKELRECVAFLRQALDHHLRGSGTDEAPQRTMEDLLRYLNGNLHRAIPRTEAAQYLYLNEDYFSRLFRKETGMGYKEYLLKRKMEYAARLLRDTELPITLIASRVGYDNYNNFTQMFRKEMGVTPTEYRKQS